MNIILPHHVDNAHFILSAFVHYDIFLCHSLKGHLLQHGEAFFSAEIPYIFIFCPNMRKSKI